MSTVPIANYALLSDCRSAALVSQAGSVDWLCFPRFDSPSVFGRLLDHHAGHWSLSVAGTSKTSRRYLDSTMVLETACGTSTGTAALIDAMAIGRNERGHQLGVDSPGVLLRVLTCTSGFVEVDMEYTPRPEYGLIAPLMRPIPGGIVARGGASVLVLSSSVALEVSGLVAQARFTLHAGEAAYFALEHQASWEGQPAVHPAGTITRYLEDTITGWRTWSDLHQRYTGPWSDLVHHSGRVLQALMYRPTGALVAAPTTSLPESVGGERNWDYRYTWVRDACLTLEALWVAACPDEAQWFFDWMAGAVAAQIRQDSGLQIMFGVGGEHDLTERTLDHLSGWRGSRPVRVGNGAWNQKQLDVYGELLSAARRLRPQLGDLDPATRTFLVEAAHAAAGRWQEPDQGIWEVRGGPQHFLYSKLMCWVALDAAVELADELDAHQHVPAWTSSRERIREAVLKEGWSERQSAFTQAFGSDELDASALMMPIVGFLPAADPRMRSTIEAIAERLTDEHGLVYRYQAADGLAGGEGSFLLCTFWLSQALALAGETDRARATFERAIAFRNDVGLLAEEVDPTTGELLGNFPQAFSHIGLVNAAWTIAQAEAP